MAVKHMDGFDTTIPLPLNGYTVSSTRTSMALVDSPEGSGDKMLQCSMTAGTAGQNAELRVTRTAPTGWGNYYGYGILLRTARAGAMTMGGIDTVPTAGAQGIITFGKDANNFCVVNGVSRAVPMELNVYHYLELELDKVALRARAWLNNELVAEVPMTGSETTLSHWFGFSGIQTTTAIVNVIDYNDYYVADGTGPYNNARLGKCKVGVRRPRADSLVEFSRNAGASNASQVQDPGQNDGDTTYVYSNQEGATDLYSSTDPLLYPEAPVLAVAVTTVARKEGPEARAVAPMIRVGSVEEIGDRVNLLVATYTAGTTVFNVNPATGGAWDAGAAASATFGQQLVV